MYSRESELRRKFFVHTLSDGITLRCSSPRLQQTLLQRRKLGVPSGWFVALEQTPCSSAATALHIRQ